MRYLFLFVSLTVFLGTGSNLRAHPGDDHVHEKPANLRIWKDADGLFELEAAFVVVKDGKVLLARIDGSPSWIPLDRLSRTDRDWVERRQAEIRAINDFIPASPTVDAPSSDRSVASMVVCALFALAGIGFAARRKRLIAPAMLVLFAAASTMLSACSGPREGDETEFVAWDDGPSPAQAADFQAFKDKLKVRWNNDTLFIDSNGLPDHPMMIGITAWQQQVPLPQPYAGNNAWQIPLKPRLADKPISAKNALYRGAIALAVNGVPIFNALNNRGEDAFLIGELDEFGGHCGKGDDYHYHVAPLHLEKLVGTGKPIAYALDGFPLYGLTDRKLDEFNGRFDEKGNYRYHSTKTYPYINGGMRGVVEVRNDGIEPQPRDAPLRKAQAPLRGAKITGFTVDDARKNFALKYEVRGQMRKIHYTINADNTVTFVFVDEVGKEQTETYTRRQPKGKKDDEKKKKGKGPDEKK